MKFYRNGEETADQPDEVAFEAPCAHCKATVQVSRFTEDIVKMCNRICRTKGWAPITRSECALCAPCYVKHRQKLADKAEWELRHQAECWSMFISKWGTGSVDDADMERTFARDFPHLRGQMRDWLAAKKEKGGAPAKADAAAGFGRSRNQGRG